MRHWVGGRTHLSHRVMNDFDKRPAIRRSRRVVAATLAICLFGMWFTSAASARRDRDWEACTGDNAKTKIIACTNILSRGGPATARKRAIVHTNRSNGYYNNKEYDLAIRDCDEAIRIDPNYALAYVHRGFALAAKGDYDKAVQDYDSALRLNPRESFAYNGRGLAFFEKREFDKAIEDHSEAFRLNPRYPGHLFNRGNAFFEKGEYDRAIIDYNEALKLNWTSPWFYGKRGYAYLKKKEYDTAIRDLNSAIRYDPNFTGAYLTRGMAFASKHEYDRAISDFNRALQLDPKSEFAYGNRGSIYIERGDYDRAIRDYEEVIRLNPASAEAYAHIGLVYEKKSDFERARTNFKTALAIEPKDDSDRAVHQYARERLAVLGEHPQSQQPSQPSQAVESPAGSSVVPGPQPAAASRPPAMASAPPVAVHSAVTPPQPLGRRVALVIGNTAYATAAQLPNARVDAEAVAATLRDTGFTKVVLETELTRERMLNALRAFAGEAEGADWATVYFAGHGIEMNGINYMIPTDAKLSIDRDLEFEAVPLDRLMSAVDGAKKLRLVMLDACRDNPFLNQMRRSVATRSIGRGLASVEPEAGTLVVFAAKHGQVAFDGEGKNSPFVAALVKRIKTPGLEVRRLFDLVRDDVMTTTKRRQQPFSYGSVSGSEDFFFVAK